MDIKKILLILTIFISTVLANDKVSLQLLWKHQFEFAGFYMAKEKGFYKDANLDVEFKEFKFGMDITKEVEEGKSTYGINYPSVILDYTNGHKIILLNAILQSSPHVLVSLKSDNIKSIGDFKNKKIMIFDNAMKSASLKSMLSSQGISMNDMKFVKSKFDIDTLLDGSTDIKAVYLSNEVYELKQKKVKFNIWDPKDYGFDFYDDLLFTSKKELENNPERVKRFQNASIKGWEYAFNNIDETIKVIKEKYNSQSKSIKALKYEAQVLKSLAYYRTDKLGKIDENKIQRIYDIYNLMGLSHYKLNIQEIIYNNAKNKIVFSKKEKEYLKTKKYINMCVDPDWMPFEKIENNKHIGIASDFFESFQKELPIPIKLIKTNNWLESIEFAKNRKCDIFSLAMKTPQRSEYMNFTPPYLKIPMVLATKTDVIYIENLEDLKDKKIGIIKGYASADILKSKYTNINFVEIDSLDEALQQIISEKLYGVIDNLAVLTNKIEKNYIGAIKFSSKLKENFELGVATRNDQKELLDIFKKLILNFTDEDKIKVLKKWLPIEKLEQNSETNKIDLSNKQIEYLKNKKVIKMCNNPTWAPIEFSTEIFDNIPSQNHDMQGIVIDTLKLLEKKLNVKFEHVHTNGWKESQEYLKDGKCDILPAATITKSRKEYANFTKPYLSYELAILTQNAHPIVYGIEDMLNKTMARKKGSGLIANLKEKYPKIKILETSSTKESFLKTSNGKVDYTIAALPVASYYISKLAITNLQISGYLDMRYHLSIAVKKDEPLLREILDLALASLSWSDKKEITDSWTRNVLKEVTNTKIIWQTLLVVGIIVLFLLYRQYTLAKYNKELKNTKEELEVSLKEVQYLLDTTLEGILLTKDGICVDANDEVVKLLHLKSKDEIIGKSNLEFITPEFNHIVKQSVYENNLEPYEIMAKRPDGSVFPVLIKGKNIKTSKYESVRLTCILDISELKEKDKLIADQSKMAAMGEMIGNIAHQWRQPLSVISVAASALKLKDNMNVLTSEDLNASADSIIKSTKYLSQTIDDFRDFIKGDKNPNIFNISENIHRNLSILEGMLKTNEIEVILELEDDLSITNYENELTQAIINIINNAKDALKTSNVDRKLIFIKTFKKDDFCVITIKDNGNGISKDSLNKIFEPYFTTKHKSQGTGLGLFMTHKIITESMHGNIKAVNTKYIFDGLEYKGALFEISLPIKKG